MRSINIHWSHAEWNTREKKTFDTPWAREREKTRAERERESERENAPRQRNKAKRREWLKKTQEIREKYLWSRHALNVLTYINCIHEIFYLMNSMSARVQITLFCWVVLMLLACFISLFSYHFTLSHSVSFHCFVNIRVLLLSLFRSPFLCIRPIEMHFAQFHLFFSLSLSRFGFIIISIQQKIVCVYIGLCYCFFNVCLYPLVIFVINLLLTVFAIRLYLFKCILLG